MSDTEMSLRNLLMMAIWLAWIYIWWALKLTVRGKVIKDSYSFRIK